MAAYEHTPSLRSAKSQGGHAADKQRIVVFGATGYLGRSLVKELADRKVHSVIGVSRTAGDVAGVTYKECDLMVEDCRKQLLAELFSADNSQSDTLPDVVVYLTASTNWGVVKSESEAHEMRLLNVDVPCEISQLCGVHDVLFIFTSSDAVFNGDPALAPFAATARTQPASAYGESKVEAETKLFQLEERTERNWNIILRLGLLFDLNSKFSKFVVSRLKAVETDGPLRLFTDEFRTPILTEEVCRIVVHFATDRRESAKLLGRPWNLGGPETLSRYDVGLALCEALGFDSISCEECAIRDVIPPHIPRPPCMTLASQVRSLRSSPVI